MRRLATLPAAAMLAVGGLVHLDLWRDGYRVIDTIGVLFLVNAAVSAVLVGALVAAPRIPVIVAGIIFAAGSLAALVASRTVGLFGFTEAVWTDAAWHVATSELGVVIALAVVLAGSVRRSPAAVPALVGS